MNKLFVLSFENKEDREGFTGYYLPVVKMQDYKFKIDGKNAFD